MRDNYEFCLAIAMFFPTAQNASWCKEVLTPRVIAGMLVFRRFVLRLITPRKRSPKLYSRQCQRHRHFPAHCFPHSANFGAGGSVNMMTVGARCPRNAR